MIHILMPLALGAAYLCFWFAAGAVACVTWKAIRLGWNFMK